MRRLLTPDEVADYYRVTVQTVRSWIKAGSIEAINVSPGNRPTYRIPEDSLHNPKLPPPGGPAPRPRKSHF